MSSLPVPSGRPKGADPKSVPWARAATAPLFIAFPGNVCPKGNVAIVHEKGRLIPAIIARELPSPLVPPLPVDKLAINRLFAVDCGALPGQWVHAARRAALVSR